MNAITPRWERYSPVSLGLEDIFHRLDALTDAPGGNYPPYNIIKTSDTTNVLEIALAGFSKDEIEVVTERNVLTVTTTRPGKDEREYTYRGLAQRTFARNWQLSDDVVVDNVDYKDGLLTIALRKELPENQKRNVLPIS